MKVSGFFQSVLDIGSTLKSSKGFFHTLVKIVIGTASALTKG